MPAMGKAPEITAIHTDDAPGAIGPYVQATSVARGRMVFCSGQIPLDPKTGQLIGSDDVRAATHQVLKNLRAVVTAAGGGLHSVAKTNIYLTDMGDFAAVNEVYAEYFPNNPPARACVAVSALPKGVAVEIEAVAFVDA